MSGAGSSSRAGTFAQPRRRPPSGLAVLAPGLRDRYDLSLTRSACFSGIERRRDLTLLPWGLAADYVGERVTGTAGLLGAGIALGAAGYAPGFASLALLLAISGAFGASINTATGRAVTSWFTRETAGFALGIRQTSVPIGGFAAALGIPVIADQWGTRAALLVLAAFSLVSAALAAVWLVEGPVRGAGRTRPTCFAIRCATDGSGACRSAVPR